MDPNPARGWVQPPRVNLPDENGPRPEDGLLVPLAVFREDDSEERRDATNFQRILAELASRRAESLRLYRPLPRQSAFHASSCRHRLARGSNRSGKAQPVDEPVLTPFGWAAIGSLQVGDLVIGGDGRPARVTGVFPQGIKPVFKVSFSDGASTHCCSEHLWKVAIRSGRFGRKEKLWTVMELGQIVAVYGQNPSPANKPLIPSSCCWMPERKLPINPYLMGLLIGDGCYSQTYIGFTTADQEIVDAFSSSLPSGVRVKKKSRYDYSISSISPGLNPVTQVLRFYCMKGKRAQEKSIPEDYLFNSIDNRMRLLHGLLDTDGSVAKKGDTRAAAEFSTTSPALAEQVAFLVRSLGGTCRVTWRQTRYEYKRQHLLGRKSARCYIRMPDGVNPFSLRRKADGFGNPQRPFVGRLMESIEPAGEAECVCISVDTPDHTYVTKDCIVTHNTLCSAVEIARAVTNQDPHDKYPKENGRVFAIGKNLAHCGDVMYRKLFRAGAFKMIKDADTRLWRVYRENDPADAAREKEAKPAPPLIPRRFVKEIAWFNKKANQPQIVRLRNGWEINFFSSEGKPPQGSDIDICWLDEEIIDPEWLPEMQFRIGDRKGCIIWSATPQAGTEGLFDLHERAEEDEALPPEERGVEEFLLLLADNDYMGDKVRRDLAADALRQGPDAYRVRVKGEFAIDSRKVYPEWGDKFFANEFQVPKHWTRYAFVDPGRQVCAVWFLDVPPANEDLHRYNTRELYITDCDARKFALAMAEVATEKQIQAAWIDRHESRKKETGSGLTIEEQYSKALKQANVKFVENGYGFYGAPDDAKARRLALHSWLNEDEQGITRLKVFRRCVKFDWEMRRYRHKVIKGYVDDEVVKRNDHLCDGAGYAALVDPPYRKPKRQTLTPSSVLKWLLAKRAKRRSEQGSPRVNLGPGK